MRSLRVVVEPCTVLHCRLNLWPTTSCQIGQYFNSRAILLCVISINAMQILTQQRFPNRHTFISYHFIVNAKQRTNSFDQKRLSRLKRSTIHCLDIDSKIRVNAPFISKNNFSPPSCRDKIKLPIFEGVSPMMLALPIYIRTMHQTPKNTQGSTWLWTNPLLQRPDLSFPN